MLIKKFKVAAIVILYFPERGLLGRLIKSLCNDAYIDHIFLVDNTPAKDLKIDLSKFTETNIEKVTHHLLGVNQGLAKAQNFGIELAIKGDFDHVILFDQDSKPLNSMVERLLIEEQSLLDNGIEVGTVGPAFIDEKTNKYGAVINYGFFMTRRVYPNNCSINSLPADYVISSGCLIRVKVLKNVGLMMEELFIDWVDIEWCLRAKSRGYKNFVVPVAKMMHSVGDSYVSLVKRQINLHANIRNFYIVRNACYLISNPTMGWKFRINTFLKIPLYIIFFSITSKSRLYSLRVLIFACWQGFSKKLGGA